MKKLLTLLIFLWAPVVMSETYTYDELLDSLDGNEPMRVRKEQGIIGELDLPGRSMIVSGFSYQVGPSYASNPVQVSLQGTTAGSFELLSRGMKVELIYIDFGIARIAFEINELDSDAEVEF